MSFFKGEFFSTHLDDDYMRSNGPDKIINYKSAIREDFKEIMKITKPTYDKLVEKGLKIEVNLLINVKNVNLKFWIA